MNWSLVGPLMVEARHLQMQRHNSRLVHMGSQVLSVKSLEVNPCNLNVESKEVGTHHLTPTNRDIPLLIIDKVV